MKEHIKSFSNLLKIRFLNAPTFADKSQHSGAGPLRGGVSQGGTPWPMSLGGPQAKRGKNRGVP
jgi:hypothetical protein